MKDKIKTDIAIVGGGPAGLSAARAAAQDGNDVILFEKSEVIGEPVHSSGGTWISSLKEINFPEKFYNPVKKIKFVGTNESASFNYPKARTAVTDVRMLYQHLAKRASFAGARIIVNAKVEGVLDDTSRKPKGIKVKKNGQISEVHCNVIIDASGTEQMIAKDVGLTEGFKRFGVGAEYELIAPGWNQEEVDFIVNNEFAPAGYGWIFPLGGKRIRLGIGLIKPDAKVDPRSHLEKLLSHNMKELGMLNDCSQIEYHSGLIPSDSLLESTVSNGVIVVGDAAGQISALAGEGIRYAMKIGKDAGRVSSQAVQDGNFSEDFLKRYEDEWEEEFKRDFQISYAVNKHIASYTDKEWDKKIKLLSNLELEEITKLLRTELSVKTFAKITKQNPSLIPKEIYNLIKSKIKDKAIRE